MASADFILHHRFQLWQALSRMRRAIYPCVWRCLEFLCPNHRCGVEAIQDAHLRFHPPLLLQQRDNACNLRNTTKVQISNMPIKIYMQRKFQKLHFNAGSYEIINKNKERNMKLKLLGLNE